MVVGNDVGMAISARHPANDPEQERSLLFSSPDHVGLNKNEPTSEAESRRNDCQGPQGRHHECDFAEMAACAVAADL